MIAESFWHQQHDDASSFLTTFNTELGRFHYIVMQCFCKIDQIIIIVDDIMIVGCKPDHSDHD